MFMLYKDEVIVERLAEAYREKICEYYDAMCSGNGLDGIIWDTLILLGKIMGKTEEDIIEDMSKEREKIAEKTA